MTSKLSLSLKVFKNGQMVQMYRSRRKLSFIKKLKAVSGEKYSLLVGYGNTHSNFGDYCSKQELVAAYEAFTQQSLVQDLQGGNSGK